ncbi:MAG: hypothetical protein OEV78_13075 [Spirochaetia bacterium]|nr:hypothetical protein [Spirochaetia bacterium]
MFKICKKTNKSIFSINFIFIILFEFTIFSCGTAKGGLHGKITDNTGTALSGVHVVLNDKYRGEDVLDIYTGTDGTYDYYEYTFVMVNGGCGPDLSATFEKTGFVTVSKHFGMLCDYQEYNVTLQ